jgi:hypothetical protein
MSAFQRSLSFLVFVLLSVLATACASTPKAPASTKVLVTLRNYETGKRFELASESHTDRVTYYSSERSDATRKIQKDDVMHALVSELERLDYGSHARAGEAPASGNETMRWALELASDTRTLNWTIGTGNARDEWLAFQKCRDTFLELYNVTMSFQSVQNDTGSSFFQDPQPSSAPKKK